MELGEHGWTYACHFSAVISLVSAFGLWMLKHYAEHQPHVTKSDNEPTHEIPTEKDFRSAPDLAWLGWIGTGMTCVVLCIVRSLFPVLAERELKLPEFEQGTVFFLLSMAQGIAGLFLCRATVIMFRAKAVLLFGLLGIVGVGSFALRSDSSWVFFVGAVCTGIYSGFNFFYLVFHSLTHPSRSARYISMNEMIVGTTGIAAPLLAGFLAEATHSYVVPFVIAAAIIACAITFQAVVHILRPLKRPPGSQAQSSSCKMHRSVRT